MTITYLAQLELLPVAIINAFRTTGKSSAMNAELKQYVKELDAVLQIKESERFDNIARIARKLQIRYPHLVYTVARERVYDAFNFFHVNDSVSTDAWDAIYADKMEDLAAMCLAKGNEKTAKEALALAHDYRTKAKSRIKPEDMTGNTYIISIDIKPEDLGFETGNLKEIARRKRDGYYLNMINSLNTSGSEKKRLMQDAGISEAEIIEENE
jgi:hypothetical protein